MMTARTADRSHAHLVWGVLVMGLLLALPALAQDLVVTAADPPSAEQETYDLEVMVSGDNFGTDSVVDFLVSGTENPGGIHVKKVKRQGPKNLKVTIDVDADAVLDNFDIRVMSRGRTGKGIELFRVTEKTTGADDTPPGAPVLTVVDTSYWSVTLEWVMPADDGTDVDSGPVQTCYVHCGLPGEPLENCRCAGHFSFWGNPGEIKVCEVFDDNPHDLLQSTEYRFEVACKDETIDGVGPYGAVQKTTSAFDDVRAPGWITEEVPAALDESFGHVFDASDNPVIVGTYGEAARIVRGSWNGTLWGWQIEDLDVHADDFAMHPWGQPAFVGIQPAGRRESELAYTFWDGSQWISELVTTVQDSMNVRTATLAFDPRSGQPVVGHCEWTDKKGGSGGLVLHWRSTGGSWTRDEIDSRRCAYGDRSGPSIAFDPTGTVAVAFGLLDDDGDLFADVLQVAVRAFGSSTWELETPGDATKVGWAPDILYAPALGGFVLGWNDHNYTQDAENRFCERRGAATWWCEAQDGDLGDENDGSPWVAVDNGGRVFLATGGSRPGEPGVILIDRDPSTDQWNIQYIDYYQEYEWQGEFPVQDYLHLALTPPSLDPEPESPLLPDSPTLSWTWNARYGQPADYHLYFAWKP